MTTAQLVKAPEIPAAEIIASVVLEGDLAKLTGPQKLAYYNYVCQTVGLNPLTQPFSFLRLSGKLVLYANKDATDQLRKLHTVSIEKLERELVEDIYTVTAYAKDKTGRTDAAIGAVPLANQKGEMRANLMMKAETKAKRRVTLSICGLGILDETEVGSVPSAEIVHVDMNTGEIVGETPPPPPSPEPPRERLYKVVSVQEMGKTEKGDPWWIVKFTPELAHTAKGLPVDEAATFDAEIVKVAEKAKALSDEVSVQWEAGRKPELKRLKELTIVKPF